MYFVPLPKGCRKVRAIDRGDFCVECKVEEGYYLYPYGIGCIDKVPAGMGVKNLQNGLVSPCLDSNCNDCSKDYNVCVQCRSESDYSLEGWQLRTEILSNNTIMNKTSMNNTNVKEDLQAGELNNGALY